VPGGRGYVYNAQGKLVPIQPVRGGETEMAPLLAPGERSFPQMQMLALRPDALRPAASSRMARA
jgi:hypothetical protein